MNRLWTLALGALAITMCGCHEVVLDPFSPGSGAEDIGQGNRSAIAMRMSQWDPPADAGGLYSVSIPIETTPDDLVLFFSDSALSCADPILRFDPADEPECGAAAFWQYGVVIPADMAHPGLIHLEDQLVYVYMASFDEECSGVSGNTVWVPGTLAISSVDATEVSFSLNVDLDIVTGWPDGDGTYTASFCP